MTQYVYMNERIRQKRPTKPVIVCQAPERIYESNHFALVIDGRVIGRVVYNRKGLDACETHDVKAWVELCDDVFVLSEDLSLGDYVVLSGEASAKLPNRPVKMQFGVPPAREE